MPQNSKFFLSTFESADFCRSRMAKFAQGDVVLARQGPLFYKAKVIKVKDASAEPYQVHFDGWKKRFDMWVTKKSLMAMSPKNLLAMEDHNAKAKVEEKERKEQKKRAAYQQTQLRAMQKKAKLLAEGNLDSMVSGAEATKKVDRRWHSRCECANKKVCELQHKHEHGAKRCAMPDDPVEFLAWCRVLGISVTAADEKSIRPEGGVQTKQCGEDKLLNYESIKAAEEAAVQAQAEHALLHPQQPKPRPASGFYGVSASEKRWRARINYNSKKHNLGIFGTKQEAALAYDREARQCGEDMLLNYESMTAAEDAAAHAQAAHILSATTEELSLPCRMWVKHFQRSKQVLQLLREQLGESWEDSVPQGSRKSKKFVNIVHFHPCDRNVKERSNLNPGITALKGINNRQGAGKPPRPSRTYNEVQWSPSLQRRRLQRATADVRAVTQRDHDNELGIMASAFPELESAGGDAESIISSALQRRMEERARLSSPPVEPKGKKRKRATAKIAAFIAERCHVPLGGAIMPVQDTYRALQPVQDTHRPRKKTPPCEHGRNKNSCRDCGTGFCKHARKGYCKDCGIGYCEHGRQKARCNDCGVGYCVHGRQKGQCKDCGTGYCKHGRQKLKCKDCGTGQCVHGRWKQSCKDCSTYQQKAPRGRSPARRASTGGRGSDGGHGSDGGNDELPPPVQPRTLPRRACTVLVPLPAALPLGRRLEAPIPNPPTGPL
jgi:hypothetical protein